MSAARKSRLVGPVIAIRTYRTDDGKLDLAKQRRQLRWMINQRMNEGNGIIMGAGRGGDGYFMSYDDRWTGRSNRTVDRM